MELTCLIVDDFVKSPISALRFISLALRRTSRTPRATRFARLELGLFTKSSDRRLSSRSSFLKIRVDLNAGSIASPLNVCQSFFIAFFG
jgi:hypothetical protein